MLVLNVWITIGICFSHILGIVWIFTSREIGEMLLMWKWIKKIDSQSYIHSNI